MTILYGIKNCDTVKKARNWLEQHGIDYQFHDFRTDGLSETQINHWIRELGLEQLVNKRSTTWKALDDASKAAFSESTAPKIIAANPTLIKRPLLDTGSHKQLGFKEAEYQQLFS
ncbi:ArsC family reductase [Cellvibrio japonicus]|uniref:Protein yffB n=1 Tax=Cellvibrio japonicus (strain Ueda107) TaxID=498211 RepID=B3PBN7_CELJU|nr:ArsC family reductase [Cellvibrio japonicus]ACE84571.1 Protein yffB [Cellvibrio japonicus Ueda107]QEI11710.1 ArsC family reductase [Cellvibrio japonicus]QEI15284.1 ArsC family reductase [Cellvibrio japonicus]QEI18864.1 ArsC family reductase [Cellvibrio japonicus]